MKRIILGAGPTGLSVGYELAENATDFEIVDRAPRVGGMSASFQRSDYILDFGPHAFHIKKGEVTPLVEDLCREVLLRKIKKTQMLLMNKFLEYPLNITNLLSNMNLLTSFRIIRDYVKESVENGINSTPELSFEDWGVKRFGRTLYDLCFGSYTQKAWGMPPTKLDRDLAGQKLTGLSLRSLLLHLFKVKDSQKTIYFTEFYYPRYGIQQLWDAMISRMKASCNAKIHLNASIKKLIIKNNKLDAIIFEQNGIEKIIEHPFVISTIPLRYLINLLIPKPSKKVINTTNALKYRNLVLVYIVFDKDRCTDQHWIYLLDKPFSFNRICEQKNMSEDMIPKGKTVICMEKNCSFRDPIWRASDDELFKIAIRELELTGLGQAKEVIEYFVVRLQDAYPIYDLNYRQNLKFVMRYVSTIDNLITVGRQGLFLNNDMHDCIEMGFLAARHALKNDGSKSWHDKIQQYIRQKYF